MIESVISAQWRAFSTQFRLFLVQESLTHSRGGGLIRGGWLIGGFTVTHSCSVSYKALLQCMLLLSGCYVCMSLHSYSTARPIKVVETTSKISISATCEKGWKSLDTDDDGKTDRCVKRFTEKMQELLQSFCFVTIRIRTSSYPSTVVTY